MAPDRTEVALSMQDLREVTAFAAGCAEAVLEVFQADRPDDTRPRTAIEAAWEFGRHCIIRCPRQLGHFE